MYIYEIQFLRQTLLHQVYHLTRFISLEPHLLDYTGSNIIIHKYGLPFFRVEYRAITLLLSCNLARMGRLSSLNLLFGIASAMARYFKALINT